MAGLPTSVQVLLDDGTGTFPYDISSKCRIGHQISRGRQDELSAVTPGQLQALTLDNTDGRFTPGSTIIGSPSPIKADARIRVKETANGTTFTRYTGYVQSWPVGWPTGGQTLSEVTVTAVDAQARAERRPLRSVIEEEIMADSPVAYYTLGDPADSTSAADSSGNQASSLVVAGAGAAIVFGNATGPSFDGLTAVTFGGGQYLQASGIVPPVGYGFVVAFSIAAPPAAVSTFVAYDLSNGSFPVSFSVLTDGKVRLQTNLETVTTAGSLADGLWHVAEIRNEHDFYIDNALVGSLTTAPSQPPILIVGAGIGGANPFAGSVAHLAYVPTVSTARVTAHYQAMITGFAGEAGTARLTRTAGYAGIPVGTLDTSLTNVAFEEITGKSAAEAVRDVSDAEFGITFIDGSGNLTFHNRNKVAAKTAADVTLDANYLDPGTAFTTDMQGVINYFEVTAKGSGNGAQLVRDTASETSHGRYASSAEYLVLTDAEALARGNWIIATHKEPGPRAGTLVLDLLSMTAAQQAQMLAIETNHWFQVTGLPSQTPGGTTVDFIVQGFTETLTKDVWTLALNVVSKATVYPSAWILDNATYSVLDSTTRLFV